MRKARSSRITLISASRALLALCLVLLASATAASAQEAESAPTPVESEGTVVFAIEAIFGGTYSLRRVDLEASAFVGQPIELGESRLFSSDDRLPRPTERSLRGLGLLARNVPPGHYAITYAVQPGYPATVHYCRAEFAVVFAVEPRRATIWSSTNALPPGITGRFTSPVSDQVLTQQYDSARATRPDLLGDAIVAAPIAAIAWDTRSVRRCNEGSAFRIIRTYE